MFQIKKIITTLIAVIITGGTLMFLNTHAYATVTIEGEQQKMFLPKNYTIEDVAEKLQLNINKVTSNHNREKKLKHTNHVIEFKHHKNYSIIIDGITHEGKTTELYVSDLVNTVNPNFDFKDAHLSQKQKTRLIDINKNEQLVVSSLKQIPVTVADKETIITTNAPTVQEILNESNIHLSPEDEINKPLESFVTQKDTIEIITIEVKNKTVKEKHDLPVTQVEDPSLTIGSTKTVKEGKPAVIEKTMAVVYANGKVREQTEVSRSTLSEGSPKIVARGKKPATVAPGGSCGGWNPLLQKYFPTSQVGKACRVMMCESGGNPTIQNSRSSASGLFQFIDGTWRTARQAVPGASKYVRAKDAPAEIQIMVAAKWLQRTSWNQWSCK